MSTVYQNRYRRVRKLIQECGSSSAFADRTGLARQQVTHIASDRPVKQIGDRLARKIESAMGLPVGALDASEEDEAAKDQANPFSVEVPLLNVTAGMGANAQTPWSEEVVHRATISKEWLRQNTTATAYNRLAIVTGRGDSMRPTISHGDTLLVDTSSTAIKQDAIYVLSRDGDIYIKRVARNIDGTYDIISDNPAYEKRTIKDPLKEGLLILGRVLCVWKPDKV